MDAYSYCSLVLKNNNVGIITPNAEVLNLKLLKRHCVTIGNKPSIKSFFGSGSHEHLYTYRYLTSFFADFFATGNDVVDFTRVWVCRYQGY
jgi:hypothetical protein